MTRGIEVKNLKCLHHPKASLRSTYIAVGEVKDIPIWRCTVCNNYVLSHMLVKLNQTSIRSYGAQGYEELMGIFLCEPGK